MVSTFFINVLRLYALSKLNIRPLIDQTSRVLVAMS